MILHLSRGLRPSCQGAACLPSVAAGEILFKALTPGQHATAVASSCISSRCQQARSFGAAADGSEASSSGATSSSTTSSGANSSGGEAGGAPAWQQFFARAGRRKAKPGAWKERMPAKGREQGRYGVLLQQRDPERFERMRLILGWYEQPENASYHQRRPPPPKSVTINNLQTLFFTRDIDHYYKLALLSYRTKQTNKDQVNGALARTARLLDRLEGERVVFRPVVPDLREAAAAGEADGGGSSSSSGGGGGGEGGGGGSRGAAGP